MWIPGTPKDFVTFKEFKAWCRKKGFKTEKDFKGCKRPWDIPSNPNLVYEEWPGWKEVLGTTRKYMTFEEAVEYIRGIGLRGYMEWVEWSKSGVRPESMPTNPWMAYRKEWRGWKYFLGTEYVGYREASRYAGETIARLQRHWTKVGNRELDIERPPNVPLAIRYKYPKQWRGIRKFLKAGPMPLEQLHEIVLSHGLKRAEDYIAFHRENKVKGMRSQGYLSTVYGRKYPGWKKFIRGEF
jgi:hypothetical protein